MFRVCSRTMVLRAQRKVAIRSYSTDHSSNYEQEINEKLQEVNNHLNHLKSEFSKKKRIERRPWKQKRKYGSSDHLKQEEVKDEEQNEEFHHNEAQDHISAGLHALSLKKREAIFANVLDKLAINDPRLKEVKNRFNIVDAKRPAEEFIKRNHNVVKRSLVLQNWLETNPNGDVQEFYDHYKNDKEGNKSRMGRFVSVQNLFKKILEFGGVSTSFENPSKIRKSSINTKPKRTNIVSPSSVLKSVISSAPGKYETVAPDNYVRLYNTTFQPLCQHTIDTKPIYEPIEVEQKSEVPTLKHSLSRVLFSPGVHHLQDPRTKVYNFNPYLKNILPINEFDFQHITQYITSEKDQIMLKLSKLLGTKYYSSTSSMTGVLSHMHFLLSNFRPVYLGDFSKHVKGPPHSNFSRGAKLPASVIVRQIQGHYAIDSDKSSDKEMILSMLGHSLERLLTSSPEDFDKYKLSNKSEENSEAQLSMEKNSNAYHYAKMGNFIMRSQLDCKDSRLPGTGTFDLKTRAVAAIRHDLAIHETVTTGYELIKNVGEYESYERELKELSKATLLKYSLQARIGNMDGIFVAFHNIAKIFGFQYLPLTSIDKILHSVGNTSKPITDSIYKDDPSIIEQNEMKEKLASKIAQDEFTISMKLYQFILDLITSEYLPKTSFRMIVKAIPYGKYETVLKVLAHPVTDSEINEIQTSGLKSSKAVVSNNTQDIESHVAKLKEMNNRLMKDVKGFNIVINNKINERESNQRHLIYNSFQDDWKVDFKLSVMSEKTANADYNNYLNEKLELLTETGEAKDDDEVGSFVKILRAYSAMGKKRAAARVEEEKNIIWNKD